MDGWRVVFFGGESLAKKAEGDGFLNALAALSRSATDSVGRKPTRGIGFRMGRLDERGCSLDVVDKLPCELRSPFESCENIAGALMGTFGPDAMLKLRFAPGTVELAMHVHEHSRRMLVVTAGRGFFHVSSESLSGFTGMGVHSIPVERGDVVVFDRNVMHTFSAHHEGIELLSYHAPFIGLDDPRQYTLPKVHWYPPFVEPRSRFVA